MVFTGNLFDCWWLAPLALLLDLAFADPRMPWPHPVCWIGWLYKRLEKPGRRLLAFCQPLSHGSCPGGSDAQFAGQAEITNTCSPVTQFAGLISRQILGRLVGLLCLLVIVLVTGSTVWFLIHLPILGPILAIYLSFAGLAMGSLVQAGRDVLEVVEDQPPAEGAKALSRLVSRETSGMEKPVLLKTLADTLAENFTDALVAPFFWLLVGGPVGLWCYKAVSTGDSMWGYKTEKWLLLGWAPARGDDLLAFVPARLSVILLWLTDHACYLADRLANIFGLARNMSCGAESRGSAKWQDSDGAWEMKNVQVSDNWLACHSKPGFYPFRKWPGNWPGIATIARQAKGMTSPNSGWSMTALAWLVKARMAGPSVYFGQLVHKEWLGPPPEQALPWSAGLIHVLLALLQAGSLIGGLALCLVFMGLRVLVGV